MRRRWRILIHPLFAVRLWLSMLKVDCILYVRTFYKIGRFLWTQRIIFSWRYNILLPLIIHYDRSINLMLLVLRKLFFLLEWSCWTWNSWCLPFKFILDINWVFWLLLLSMTSRNLFNYLTQSWTSSRRNIMILGVF